MSRPSGRVSKKKKSSSSSTTRGSAAAANSMVLATSTARTTTMVQRDYRLEPHDPYRESEPHYPVLMHGSGGLHPLSVDDDYYGGAIGAHGVQDLGDDDDEEEVHFHDQLQHIHHHSSDEYNFNTSAIHGVDPYEDFMSGRPTPRSYTQSPTGGGGAGEHGGLTMIYYDKAISSKTALSYWRQRRTIFRASLIVGLLVIVIVSIAVPVSHRKQSSSSSANSNNGPSIDGTRIGMTHDGPRMPVVEVPPAQAIINKQDLGNALIELYRHYGMNFDPLGNPDTYQYHALIFVSGNAEYSGLTTIQRTQRYALACLYYATFMQKNNFWDNPTDWVSANNWVTNTTECNWEGIECDTNARVMAITLNQHALSGTIPMELGFLDQLVDLDLSDNFLALDEKAPGDPMRFFGMLTHLEMLVLDDNYVLTHSGIPPHLPSTLQRISMSYNLLQGTLNGTMLAGLRRLTHLEAESNYLSGTLPPELGGLPNLYYLYLRRNVLNINLSDMIQGGTLYQNMFSLWLDDNQVTGTIPTEIGTLTGMASFSLTNTSLQGTIPTEFGLLTAMQRMWLYSNELTGTVPAELGDWPSLQVLELYHNQLVGAMPIPICQAIANATYQYKALTVDCKEVQCSCCTTCY